MGATTQQTGENDTVPRTAAQDRSGDASSGGGRVPEALWAGAAAGVVLALADFGASWLWLPWWSDRIWLLLRMLGLLVPLGALAGAGYIALRRLVVRALTRAHRQPRAWLPDLLLLTAPALWVSQRVFAGGMMSRLPGQPWLRLLAATATLLCGGVALMVGHRLLSRARDHRLTPWALLLAGFAVGKADQLLFPKLYDYLHSCLGLLALACAFLACSLWIERRGPRWMAWPGRAAMVGTALLTLLAVDLGTLRHHQNVQVAMLEPRASTSRESLLGFEPLLERTRPSRATAQAAAEAFRRRRARARLGAATDLPDAPDAHVVLITVDALRADHLGVYGGQRNLSPELDAFASESVVFDHAYAAAPHSSYSLCSLMTSEYLHETVELGAPLPADTLPSLLGEAGFRTAGFYTLGIFHTDGERLAPYHDGAFGLDLHDHASMNADERTARVLEEADRIVAAGEPPSFLWVHYFDVHEPYEETRLGTSDLDRYDGEIQNADRGFGALVRGLRERFTHPLVIAVTADHGEEFREHGGVYHGSSLYEEQARVPLMIQLPGVQPRRVQTPVELVDVAPTLLASVRLPSPASMRGDDLRPLMVGQAYDPGPAFSAVSHLRMVVDWPYKLIANLRFGVFELYDLEHDPHERINLATSEADRRDALSEQVYAWLDSLEPEQSSPRQRALETGRLGDRRAEPMLLELLGDGDADTSDRVEAAHILGRLADPSTADGLLVAMQDQEPLVAAEAAIALGRQYDARAHDALLPLMSAEDPELRTRAAVSLGRLRDRAAVPGLLDALYVSHDSYEREEAVRWLGRLGDPRAVEPLVALLPEFRIRYLTVVALGMIGDPRAYDPLVELLTWETHSNVRDNVGRALGQLGDPRALPVVLDLARSEVDAKYTPEALVRLGAIEAGVIGGTDAHATPGPLGFTACVEGPLRHDWDYLNRTHCVSRSARARLRIPIARALRERDVDFTLLLRARRADDAHGTSLHLTLGQLEHEDSLDGTWKMLRVPVPRAALGNGRVSLELELGDEAARVDFDHALLIPAS